MLTDLELKCLWAIADDYEEIPQIKLNLENNAAIAASTAEILISLHTLVKSKLAQAYEYDESKQEFIEVDFDYEKSLLPSAVLTWRPGESSASRLWFYLTDAGKDFLKELPSPFL